MNLPPLPLTNGAFIVDNSFLETICDREKQYARLHNRIPAFEKSALSFGTAIHTALEWRYRHAKNDEVDVFMQSDQDRVLKWQYENIVVAENDHRTLEHAMELMRRYNQRYHLEPFNLLKYNEPQPCTYCNGSGEHPDKTPGLPCLMCSGTGKNEIMAEMSFLVPMFKHNDLQVLYSGRIDLPVLWDNQLVIIDHKTTSQLGELFEAENHISPQYPGYCWGFERATGRKVDAFCINGIRTKAPPMKPRGGIDEWWNESFWRSGPDYIRPGQLDEWYQNACSLVEEFLWHYSRGYLPRKAKQHCVSKYGKCGYYDVCDLATEKRENELLSDRYKDNDWSPLQKPTTQQTNETK